MKLLLSVKEGACICDLVFVAEMGKLQNLSAKSFAVVKGLLYIAGACSSSRFNKLTLLSIFFQIHCGTSTVERQEIWKFGNRPWCQCT